MNKIVIFIMVLSILFAEEQKEYQKPKVDSATVEKNIEATGESNQTKWNMRDWQNKFIGDGFGSGVIGNTQLNFSNSPTSIGFGANVNELSNSALQNNNAFKDNSAITSFDQNLIDSLVANSTNNSTLSLVKSNAIKCYITRDIPFRYTCNKTALTYGGGIDQDGRAAKLECESNCQDSYSCVNTNTATLSSDIVNINTTLDINVTYKKDIIINSDKIVSNIELIYTSDDSSNITISYIDKKDTFGYIASNYPLISDNNTTKKITINHILKSISLDIKSSTNNKPTNIALNIKINYKADNRYICPHIQDISYLPTNEYAHICPTKNIKSFSINGNIYKICSDYGVFGDNSDGTFSNEEQCANICKQSYQCTLNFSTFNTATLQTYREGCLEGQSNCSDDKCKLARVLKTPIKEEVTFDSGELPRVTIENFNQIMGNDRPKVLLSSDLSYAQRSAEEYKDEAYKYMIENSLYSSTSSSLDKDTTPSSRHKIAFSGVDYGDIENQSTRTLYWDYKPKASEVQSGNVYFYALLEAIVKRYEYDESATKKEQYDKILYIVSQTNLKPIRVKRDYASAIDMNLIENSYSKWENKTFSSNSWYYLSTTNYSEYIKNEDIKLDTNYFKRISVIPNLSNILYSLPALIRSMYNSNIYPQINYSGSFDGSGDSLANYSIYVYASKDKLTYSDIYNLYENKSIEKIYENGTTKYSNATLIDDTLHTNKDIEIYHFGELTNKSVYSKIKIKDEFIGKRGFIFVFSY